MCTSIVEIVDAEGKGKDGNEMTRVIYFADNEVSKKNHGLFCKGGKTVMAKGTLKREGKGKDAKMTLTATEIKEAKGGAKGGKGKGKGKKKDA